MSEKAFDGIQLSRRQAVTALGAGVLVAGGAAALAAAEATNWAKEDAALQTQDLEFQLSELRKQNEQAQQQLSDTHRQLAAANLQIEIYKRLVGLFDTLDQIGIDSAIGAALTAYAGTLAALEAGVDALKAGIVTAENALDNFQATVGSIRSALTAAESALANVGALSKNVQERVAQNTSPLLAFADQARRFFDDLLGKIPFGAGEPVRQTINGIVGLIAGVPAALAEMENGLFRTLREGWFSEDSARTVEATLSKPIVDALLEPLRKFLEQADATINGWESQVAQPVNKALSQRAIVYKQIAEYREQNKV